MEGNDLRYPIGKYDPPRIITVEHLQKWIEEIASLPDRLEDKVRNLESEDLSYSYRKGGWNIHELLYHITDSHTNSYIRYKWTLTEETPIIKAYNERDWAKTPDVYAISVEDILGELKVIQNRIVRVVQSLDEDDFTRTYIHPESNKTISLAVQTGMYAWHGNHHLAHIQAAIKNPVKNYIPIDCNFYDELVLEAMRKTPLEIFKGGKPSGVTSKIADLYTKNKEEFILFENGDQYRLDEVQTIENRRIYLK